MITQKLERELQGILSELQRGADYLLQDEVKGIAHATQRPNGGNYTIRNAACVASDQRLAEHVIVMNKHYGSDITGVYEAFSRLREMLERIEHERHDKDGRQA